MRFWREPDCTTVRGTRTLPGYWLVGLYGRAGVPASRMKMINHRGHPVHRAYKGQEVRDYHACFECAKLYVYPDIHTDEPDFIALDTNAAVMGKDNANHFLNDILDEAGIERDKSNHR